MRCADLGRPSDAGICAGLKMEDQEARSASGFSLNGSIMRTARRTAGSAAKPLSIKFELCYGAAESITVHTKLASSLALISVTVLQDRQYKFLLELANRFRVGNAAAIHLHH